MAKKKAKDDSVPNKAALPGMEDALPKRYPALDKLCENLISAQASVSNARTKKTEIHGMLDKGMIERNITSYFHEDSGKDFVCSTKRNITFKNRKEDKNGGSDSNGINPDGAVEHVTMDYDDDKDE